MSVPPFAVRSEWWSSPGDTLSMFETGRVVSILRGSAPEANEYTGPLRTGVEPSWQYGEPAPASKTGLATLRDWSVRGGQTHCLT